MHAPAVERCRIRNTYVHTFSSSVAFAAASSFTWVTSFSWTPSSRKLPSASPYVRFFSFWPRVRRGYVESVSRSRWKKPCGVANRQNKKKHESRQGCACCAGGGGGARRAKRCFEGQHEVLIYSGTGDVALKKPSSQIFAREMWNSSSILGLCFC